MIILPCGCGKSLAAKPEWIGISIRCAGCGRSHLLSEGAIPTVQAPVVLEAPSEPAKVCPHCEGRILAAAIKCRHCGCFLEGPKAVSLRTPAGRGTDPGGVGVLVLAIVGWVVACYLPCPIAWAMGASYEADCRRRGVEPSGAGKAGKILGLVGTVFLFIALSVFGLALAVELS